MAKYLNKESIARANHIQQMISERKLVIQGLESILSNFIRDAIEKAGLDPRKTFIIDYRTGKITEDKKSVVEEKDVKEKKPE